MTILTPSPPIIPSLRWGWLPLVISLAAFGTLFAATYYRCVAGLDRFVYPMDDSYINLAMAKNIAARGTWGTNSTEFASSSSSPLWTGVTGLVFCLTGPYDLLPLWGNVFAAVGVLTLSHSILRRGGAPPLAAACCLLAIVIFTPLIPVVFGGLEHSLHIFLTLVFMAVSVPVICAPEGRCRSLPSSPKKLDR